MSEDRPQKSQALTALLAFFGMMTTAMLFVSTNWYDLIYAPLFPTGICTFFSPLGPRINSALYTTLLFSIVAASYLAYALILVVLIRARMPGRFASICLLLAGLFVLNVAGCQKTLKRQHDLAAASAINKGSGKGKK